MKMNRAEEDYIKTIYELQTEKKEGLVKGNELSERFGYSDQSVNEMIKKLVSKGMVSFYPYKGISLTAKGKKEAIRMIRSHRIWEVFLTEKLGFSWESVHEDAERLEHAASPEVLKRLYHFLGEPKYCQHGNPIPNEKGEMKETTNYQLYQAEIGDLFEITRVLDFKELLIYLNQQHIKLHDVYEVTDKDHFNGLMTIKKQNTVKVISMKSAKMLYGIKLKKNETSS